MQANLQNLQIPVSGDQNAQDVSTAVTTATTWHKKQPLTAKNAVELLLNGTLSDKVCRYCLNVTTQLLELDMTLHLGGQTALYEITIKDMIANFYPFQVTTDPELPNKICERCLNRTLRAYLFTQQCEQAERAFHNYLDDISDSVHRLDPLERKLKRGRQKANPNHNKIYVVHENVIDYAEPIIHLVNQGSTLVNSQDIAKSKNLLCAKCWQVLPNVESLLNHEKIHPKSMWYHCHQCGAAFAKPLHLKRHVKSLHGDIENIVAPRTVNQKFECQICGDTLDNHFSYLRHIEKHKFKKVLEHVLLEKIDELCTICLDKAPKMVDLETRMAFNGSCPELNGDKSLYHIVGSTIPDMNSFFSYTGTKICQNCSDRAISTYLFINQTLHTRRRLDNCITAMLKNIEQYSSNLTQTEETDSNNVFIELSDTLIFPVTDVELCYEDLLDDDVDETQLKVEVLEDKYRIESSDEEGETPVSDSQKIKIEKIVDETQIKVEVLGDKYRIESSNKEGKIIKNEKIDTALMTRMAGVPFQSKPKKGNVTNAKKNLQNGFRIHDHYFDNIKEFLTFKKNEEPKKISKKYEYRCDLCSKAFISVYFLKKHVLRHIQRKVKCKVCKIWFDSMFLLCEHRKVAHLRVYVDCNNCELCGRTFRDQGRMEKHNKRHLNLQCSLCAKLFLTQKCYNIHMSRHVLRYTLSKRRSHQTCSFCKRECLNKNKLLVHVNKIHLKIKPYCCDMCDRTFYTKYDLKNHKKLHSVRSNEKCEVCGAISKCRRDLVVHVRKHMGVKSCSCTLCSETFDSQRAKTAHVIQTHGGRFICAICKLVFVDKSELKTHTANIHISDV